MTGQIFYYVCENATHKMKEVVMKGMILISGTGEGNRHVEGGQGKKQHHTEMPPLLLSPRFANASELQSQLDRNPVNPQS